MKTNELMISDWVECTYWTPSKQLKVAEIRRIIDDEIKIGVYCNDLVLIFRQSEVMPIPLTPEILEKNGFVDERSNYAYRTDNYHVCYYCADERLSINKYGAILDVHCFYVHQIQHALRLCGIEKEIIL